MANRDAAKGAPPELLPKIAENVVKSLNERDVAAFTDEEVTVEIMRQLMELSKVFPDKFIDHATPDAMYKSANMDSLSIVKRVIKLI